MYRERHIPRWIDSEQGQPFFALRGDKKRIRAKRSKGRDAKL